MIDTIEAAPAKSDEGQRVQLLQQAHQLIECTSMLVANEESTSITLDVAESESSASGLGTGLFVCVCFCVSA